MEFLGEKDFGQASKRLDNSEDQQFINYLSGLPSLESISAVSLAVRLWNEPDVEDFIKESCRKWDKFSYFRKEGYQNLWEDIIFHKLFDIVLPDHLTTNVSKVIKPMGLQLFEFLCELNVGFIDVFFGRRSLIHWKMDATIDKVKSVQELINYVCSREDQRSLFHISDLYKFACNYCLEEHVSSLWLSMSSHEHNMIENVCQDYKLHLVVYWTATMKNELCNLMENIKKCDVYKIYKDQLTLTQNMVSLCICDRNPFAMKYFWHHLKEEEKTHNLREWLEMLLDLHEPLNYNQDYFPVTYILCFLLSQLKNGLQQREVFRSGKYYPSSILNCLYNTWPFKRYFLPTISVMLDYLDEENFEQVMFEISYHIDRKNETDTILQEIWYISPLRLKISYIPYLEWCPGILLQLIRVSDYATVYLLLNEASCKQRKTIIFSIASFNPEINSHSYIHFINVIVSPYNQKFDEFLSEILQKNPDIFSVKLKLLATYAKYLFIEFELKPQPKFLGWVYKLLNELPDSSGVEFDPVKVFTALVFFGNYVLVDKFIEWAFRTEADAYMFKKSLLRDDNIQSIMSLINAFSGNGVDGWFRFETFLKYTFCNPEDITQFKNTYLGKLHILFRKPIKFQKKLDFCNLLLNWCIDSNCEIIQCKNSLLLSANVVNSWYPLLSNITNNSVAEWLSIIEKLNWFCPLKETISEFKNSFCTIIPAINFYRECVGRLCWLRYKKKIFICLVDRLFRKDYSSEVGSTSSFNFDLGHLLNEFSCDYTANCMHRKYNNCNKNNVD